MLSGAEKPTRGRNSVLRISGFQMKTAIISAPCRTATLSPDATGFLYPGNCVCRRGDAPEPAAIMGPKGRSLHSESVGNTLSTNKADPWRKGRLLHIQTFSLYAANASSTVFCSTGFVKAETIGTITIEKIISSAPALIGEARLSGSEAAHLPSSWKLYLNSVNTHICVSVKTTPQVKLVQTAARVVFFL